MGMKLLAYDPFISTDRAEQLGCRLVDIDLLLQEADYVTMHLPKTPETTHLINELHKMKPTARIINCARGIIETALAAALRTEIAVPHWTYETEPLGDSP